MEKNYEVNDELVIDLKSLVFELLNNWVMILISTVLVAMIGFSISKFIMTPQYQSTSELYVLSSSSSITSLADIQIGTYMANDYKVVVTSRPILDQVIDNLKLDMNYRALRSKITIGNPNNTRILQITVTDADPNKAKLITDEIAEVASAYIAEKMDQDAPTILQYGYADGGATSPNTKLNTMLGGIIGAFIAMAIVIISFLLNDTVMTVEDVEQKIGLNVLGTLPLEEEEYNGKKRTMKKMMKVVGPKANVKQNEE